MFNKTILSCDHNQSYLATVTYSSSDPAKDQVIVFVNKTGEAESNPFVASALKNPELAKKLKANNQVGVHSQSDSIFVRGVVTVVPALDEVSLLTSGADAVRKVLKIKTQSVSVHFTKSFTTREIGFFLQGFQLRNYKWEWKSVSSDDKEQKGLFKPVKEIRVFSATLDPKDPEFVYLNVVVKHILKARDLGNTRADVATTDFMLEEARRIQSINKDTVDINTISGKDLEKQGYNLIYSVGKGSIFAPHLITLNYKGKPEKPEDIVALVGKGVVFDTGGYALKPTSGQLDMYMDKCGAVLVLEVFAAVAELKLPINLVGAVGFVENCVSGHAYRNSDILVSKKGITVEINNTDAEGRLVLADVLTHVQEHFKPHTVIDFATLTGAIIVALGESTAGIFGNDIEFMTQYEAYGNQLGEALWKMPINKQHRDNIKSTVADIRQVTGSPYGGASNAAAFLEKFIEKGVKWIHTDIAGPASGWSVDSFVYNKGATGFGVRYVIDFLRNHKF